MPDATDKLMAMQRGGFEAGWAAAVRKLCAEFDWASAAKIKPAAAVEFLGKVLAGMHLRTEGNGERGTGNGEQGTGNREQGTGNREQGTGNSKFRYYRSPIPDYRSR
jgi:hypothetical protein